MTRSLETGIGIVATLFISAVFAPLLWGQQVADPAFHPKVERPMFSKLHPRLLFDEGHYNFHTAGGRYRPFAELVTADGYEVTSTKEKFSSGLLRGYDLLVIANALGEERGLSAFTDAECDAVVAWVYGGGSLLLIADHNPMGAAARTLSMRFGVEMSTAHTGDRSHYDESVPGELGQLVFTRANGLLTDNAITRGRNKAERVDRVITFTGQSLSIPAGALVILKLSDTAFDVMPENDDERSAAGRAQGVALKVKKGRVIILGEAAMLSAQLTAKDQKPMGMNYPNIDNQRLALNIVHWLSGKL